MVGDEVGGGEGAECLVLWLTVCLQVCQHEEPMAEDKHPGKMQQKQQHFKDYLQTVAAWLLQQTFPWKTTYISHGIKIQTGTIKSSSSM